jgi:hypothetical protein
MSGVQGRYIVFLRRASLFLVWAITVYFFCRPWYIVYSMADVITGREIEIGGCVIPEDIFGTVGVLLWCAIFVKAEPFNVRYSLLALAIIVLLFNSVLRNTIVP